MGRNRLFISLLLVFVICACVEAWSGNVCSRVKCGYRWKRVCRYRWWGRCCSWRNIREAYWYTQYYCCSGWTHNGNQVCTIPICRPPCENGGTCYLPGRCNCPTTHQGYRCRTAICSYNSPCYPGTCGLNSDSCTCSAGFTTPDPLPNKPNYCLEIEDNDQTDLQLTEMQVRMAYWPRYANPPMELHYLMADSSNLTMADMDFMWTNRRDFNRISTTCTSQYFHPELTDHPPYITKHGFGVVWGEIEVWLKKLGHGGVDRGQPFTSLNKTITCDAPASILFPVDTVYNCSIEDPNFDRLLEHLDALKITFKSDGGGFREVHNTDNNSPDFNQTFRPVRRELAVEFRFDFLQPHHCEETRNCTGGETMLEVPDITTVNPIPIRWTGWVDDDSKMNRYAWEVFRMTKVTGNELEIAPALALSPLINQEVFESNYTDQSYTLPGPGMYSVILEAGDLANNTKYVRRLVLYDPDSIITTDSDNPFHVSSASPVADYQYQSNLSAAIEVTWYRYFRNALHEDNALLGSVRRYPAELRDDRQEGRAIYRKEIPFESAQEDRQGGRTVDAIANERGIVNFEVQYAKDHSGGLQQPEVPITPWTDLDLNTTFTIPSSEVINEADTITVWVRATDAMSRSKVERRKVTFDSTPPSVQQPQFIMNVPVEGIDFSSTFSLITEDEESGIGDVLWTFTRVSNGQVVHQQRLDGRRVEACPDFTTCRCTTANDCFPFNQSYSLSNCHMIVEKENLDTEVINVTVDVTNMAGLTTRIFMQKYDLTQLNGTEAYFPPLNITVVSKTQDSVTISWTFPPSCFARTALWVVVNDVKRPVHKDATIFAVTGLEAGTEYTIFMVTDYEGNEQSDMAPLTFLTEPPDPFPVGAIVGIIIGLLVLMLLIVLIIIFCLWRKGKIFQKEGTPVNKQLHRVSRALTTVRKTVTSRFGEGGAFSNSAYKADPDGDEIYMYGSMAFGTRPTWQMEDSSLTLMDHVGEGRFATIYKASWRHDGRQDSVTAKMLKPGFTEDDAMKMMAKINFMATQIEDHDNVIKFIGAVTDNQGWGPVLVMEYCETGQLDKWLVQNRGAMTEQVMENLFRFSIGIAKGMQYLASKKVVHKRLAARNILLNFLLEPKVAGFGPQQKEGEETKTMRVPAKWAAPEMLQEKPATEKSDVWSYGVVLWEIFSMGQVPYPGIQSSEIGTRLKSGYRMEKPEFADDMYYDMMRECWEYKQSKRPTFRTLRTRLDQQFSTGVRQSTDFYYDTKQLHA